MCFCACLLSWVALEVEICPSYVRGDCRNGAEKKRSAPIEKVQRSDSAKKTEVEMLWGIPLPEK